MSNEAYAYLSRGDYLRKKLQLMMHINALILLFLPDSVWSLKQLMLS